MDQEFLSIKEVAVIFGVNEATIRRAVRRGWIISIKIGEGKRSPYRVSRKTIDSIHQSLMKELSEKVKKS